MENTQFVCHRFNTFKNFCYHWRIRKTSRNVVSDFNKEFAFDSRDNLILSLFYSVSYYRLAMNIMDILKPCVNDLLSDRDISGKGM